MLALKKWRTRNTILLLLQLQVTSFMDKGKMPASEECESVLTNLTQRLTTQSTEKTVKDRKGLSVSRTRRKKPNRAYR